MIGICTPFKIDNYGTKLQAYAVQNKIKELGYDYELINFDRKSDMRIKSIVTKLYNKKNNIFSSKKKNRYLQANASDLKIRKDAINSFDKSHYRLTKEIKGYKNLSKMSNRYEALICGSDQIWLPTSINNPTATLEFGEKDVRKISFAPSFGISELPKNKIGKYRKFLNEFDYISVRETIGKNIVEKITGKDASVILDPTLTVRRSIWDELCKEERIHIDDKYIFCYFLGNNEEHRKKVYDMAKNKGLKIVTLPHFKQYNESDEKLTDIQLYDVTPCDFISLIRNAEIVCTDSFHATVFSILYHKDFYTFERFKKSDKLSANSRIYSLLGLLKISDRIVSEEKNYEVTSNYVDYENVDILLEKLRDDTDRFLTTALNGLSKVEEVPITFNKPESQNCCGCTACVSVCPKGCIKMVKDEYTGFQYPVLFNSAECIHCNMCNLVCPNKKNQNIVHSIDNPRYIISNDGNIRKMSASGGVFFHIAKYVIENKGTVCGAAYDNNFNVKHTLVDQIKDLNKLVGSKYVESDLSNVFVKIKDLLDKGIYVLFSGTPCQVHGLTNFLKKKYSNLITLDLLCYGIQSPKAWEKYKEEIKEGHREIEEINMRDKTKSWQNYSMKIAFDDGEVYLKEKEKDPYLKSYSKGLFIRPTCYECILKAFPRKSDITVGDFWDIDKIMPEENDGKGAGIIFINSDKGSEIIKKLVKEKTYTIKEIDSEKLKKIHPLFCLSAKKSKKSNKFFRLLQTKTKFHVIVKKCKENELKKILKGKVKKIVKR